jgi:Tol biopolymer transport system component
VTVFAPPRPKRRCDLDDRAETDARREQEALIKEARRRARHRRQRYAVALALLGVGMAVATMLARVGGLAGAILGDSSGAGQGAAAARNGRIAFADDDLGKLRVVSSDGSELRVIAQCKRSARSCALAEPAWSPNGKQIAFVSGLQGFPRLHETLSVSVEDSDSGRVRRLTWCGICGRPFGGGLGWSPDGSWIVFSRNSGARGAQALWLVDTAGGKLRRLTDCRAEFCVDVSPAWSPDGQRIVFSRFADAGSALYTVRPDGSQLTRITNSATAADPQWSPDGRKIAYDGDNKIFIIDADGSHQELLFARKAGSGPVPGKAGGGLGVPSWSPDGTRLAFFNTPRSQGGYRAEVWTINADGSAKRRLYRSVCCLWNWAAPVWSPDGKQIAFAASAAHGLLLIASDGRRLRRLSRAPATAQLTWQRLH